MTKIVENNPDKWTYVKTPSGEWVPMPRDTATEQLNLGTMRAVKSWHKKSGEMQCRTFCGPYSAALVAAGVEGKEYGVVNNMKDLHEKATDVMLKHPNQDVQNFAKGLKGAIPFKVISAALNYSSVYGSCMHECTTSSFERF